MSIHSTTARHRAALAVLVTFALLTLTGQALAQAEDPAQHTEGHVEEVPTEDETSLAMSVGGSLNTGNTKAWQVNAGSDFRVVRGPSALTAGAKFAYGQANLPDDGNDDFEDTLKNLNARLRYDYFLTDYDALFAASAFRWDQFAGLDARLQGQVGYLRVLYKAPNHRFWGELGYDITYDNFDPDPLPNPDFDDAMTAGGSNPEFLEGTQVVHSARVFLGYDNKVNETLTYLGGLEALINVEDPKDTRVNFDNALRSSIGGKLQLEVSFSLMFDNVPVPGATKLDTATVASLIYTLL